MRPGRLTALAGAVVALAIVLGLGSAWIWAVLHRPHAGWGGGRVDVELESGLDAGSMFERLSDAGVLRHPRLLRAWLAWRGGSGRLQAGEYRFERPISPLRLLERLEQGDVLLHAVTIREGLVLDEVVRVLDEAGFGPARALREAFADPTPIHELDPRAPDLEGYLYPDTYRFSRSATPRKIARTLVQRFREVAGDRLASRASAAGLGVREAVTLASIIEKETSLPNERARVSGVFHNRMRRGMRLESDPTVIYALRRAGRPVRRLLRQDLSFDSPWNTYVVKGLPPGPIASPGRASLEAALRPEQTDELYFVAAPGGGHRFSVDYASHLEAVARWRRYLRSSK